MYPHVALQTSVYQLRLSYAITNAGLSRENKFSGSLELSFIYFFKVGRKKGIHCFFKCIHAKELKGVRKISRKG